MDSLYSRYASALLSIAIEEKSVGNYRSEIKMLKDVFRENKDILHLLSSYFLNENDKEKIVDDIYPGNENIKNFIKVIIKNKRTGYLLKIFDEFIEKCNELDKVQEGVIYSVNKLSPEQIEKLSKAIEVKLGSKVELTNKIDSRLIGGVKIVINDKIFDGSVKNKLTKLKESLINGGL